MNTYEQPSFFDEYTSVKWPLPSAPGLAEARSGTFADNMRLPIHRWFRYSAGFSAEWAEQLITEFSVSGQKTVLDPFAGCGTTLLAAEKARAIAYGYETHPFIFRIASAKLLWAIDNHQFLEVAHKVLTNAKSLFLTLVLPEAVPNLLSKCYTQDTLLRLVALKLSFQQLSSTTTPDTASAYDLVWLAITAILRRCSHVGTAQWQYVLPNKRKASTVAVFDAYRDQISQIASDTMYAKNAGFKDSGTMHLHDARRESMLRPDSIDIVITSPPYPNNYDYADATRLEMTFWGEIDSWGDLQHAVRRFIIRSCSQHSAAERLQLSDLLQDHTILPIHSELSDVCHTLDRVRLTKGGRKTYHTMIAAYFADLAKVFLTLRSVCKQGSTLCFVIGDSAPYGVYVPVNEWLGRLSLAAGFKSFSFEKLRDRNIKWKNRKHRVPLHEGRLWIKG